MLPTRHHWQHWQHWQRASWGSAACRRVADAGAADAGQRCTAVGVRMQHSSTLHFCSYFETWLLLETAAIEHGPALFPALWTWCQVQYCLSAARPAAQRTL